MKKLTHLFGLLAICLFMLSGCYPGGAEYVSDTDVVVTTHNADYDFNSVQYYYMPDSLRHIMGDTTEEPDRSLDSFIIGELERNFEAIGYTRLDTNDILNGTEPDVHVVASVVRVTNVNIYGYPWYPGWCWGWYCYPGWGWYYPTYVTTYETGTVFWDMFDPDNLDEENEIIHVEWTGAINGVLGTTSNNKSRITNGVDQAFVQSPYLNSN